jgi:hypothetical protein
MSEHFMQDCRVCGRRLRILSSFGGQSVVCQHCRGCFVARDPARAGGGEPSTADRLLRRADQLLEMASRVLTTRRYDVPALAGQVVTGGYHVACPQSSQVSVSSL